jgi:hypothetical protein
MTGSTSVDQIDGDDNYNSKNVVSYKEVILDATLIKIRNLTKLFSNEEVAFFHAHKTLGLLVMTLLRA